MISSKKYQEYKSSNIDFIGDIPKHWEVRKLKFVSQSIQTGSTPSSKKGDYFTDGDINWYSPSDFDNNFILNDSIKKVILKALEDKEVKLYDKGSILFSGVGTVGKVGLLNESSSCNQQINIITPNNQFLSSYAIYLLFIIGLEVRKFAKATILPIFNQDETKALKIILPPLKEQEKIANFLDTKNKQIEEFIKEKQNQIKLLEEQKEAIINRAVTKGLDDSVEFKESGIEWIGDIPVSWEVKKLKFLASVHNGSTPKSTVKEFWDGDIAWISPQDISSIKDIYIHNSLRTITQKGYDNCGTYLVPKNSIILTTRAPIGNIAIATKDLCTNQGCKSIVVNKNNEYKYIYYLLVIFKKTLQSLGTGTTFLELSTTNLTSFYMPTPSQEEQKQIVKYIETETSKIDEVINQIQKECELIKEYKISLISEVVMGQIKVCDE